MRFFILWCLVLASPLRGSEAFKQFEAAIKKYPQMRSLEAKLSAKEIQLNNTGLLPEPKIEAEISTESAIQNRKFKPNIALMQMLPSRGARFFSKRAISKEGQIIELQMEVLARELLTESLLTWLKLEMNARSKNLLQEDLVLLDFAGKAISSHFRHHNYNLASVLRLQSQKAEIEVKIKNLAQQREGDQSSLIRIFGTPFPEVSFPDELELPTKGDLLEHPRARLYLKQIELGVLNVEKAKISANPDFELGVEYSPAQMTGGMGGSQDDFMLMFGMNLKLGRVRYQRLKQEQVFKETSAREDLKAWLLIQQQRETQMKSELNVSRNLLLNFEKTVIPNLEQALQSQRAGYQTSLEGPGELILVLRELLSARWERLQAYYRGWVALIVLADLYDQKLGVL